MCSCHSFDLNNLVAKRSLAFSIDVITAECVVVWFVATVRPMKS